jgi:hypothetical protein
MMTLITRQRAGPVTPGATACRLCDEPIAGTVQDRLLVGQPATDQQVIVCCQTCGAALGRLVELVGNELCVLLQDSAGGVHAPAPGPGGRAARSRRPSHGADTDAAIERTQARLRTEADTLARTERTLRAEADRLTT